MEVTREVRRVCAYCSISYTLTKLQMRQVKEKWPINCSKSCARKAQHARNHSDKRDAKDCEACGKKFVVANWDKGKRFCSITCSSINRFGDAKDRTKRNHDRLETIIRDEKYFGYIRSKAKKIAYQYGIEWEDIVQDFFLELAEGRTAMIEKVAMNTVRETYRRGMVGARYVNRSGFVIEDCLKVVKDKQKFLSSHDFIDYVFDLKSLLTESEFQVVFLALKGFNKREVYEQLKGNIPRRAFHKIWAAKGLD